MTSSNSHTVFIANKKKGVSSGCITTDFPKGGVQCLEVIPIYINPKQEMCASWNQWCLMTLTGIKCCTDLKDHDSIDIEWRKLGINLP